MIKPTLLLPALAVFTAAPGFAATLVVSAIQGATLFEDPAASKAAGGSDELYVGRVGTNTSDVQSWLNNAGTNFGWLLHGNEATSQSVKVFASSEAAAGQPSLIINYTAVPEPSSTMLAAGALFSAGRRRKTARRTSPS